MPLELANQILRLLNNLIEGCPMEERRAFAIMWYGATWPIIKGLFPEATRKSIESLMENVK